MTLDRMGMTKGDALAIVLCLVLSVAVSCASLSEQDEQRREMIAMQTELRRVKEAVVETREYVNANTRRLNDLTVRLESAKR